MCNVQKLQGVWCSDRDFFKEQEVVQGVRILLHICNENLHSEGFDVVDTCSMAMAKSHGRYPARMAFSSVLAVDWKHEARGIQLESC